jgi:putative flavoprotein involved in K+ transport
MSQPSRHIYADVVIVGAGQAGLAVSRELSEAGVDHVVLERGRIGQTWRGRWDSFCLVTPNWSVRLPGHHYDGDEPDGFMPRDEIVAYLERYAGGFDAPVREGVAVSSLRPARGGGFELRTSGGPLVARAAVLATGAYQRPHRPAALATLPADLPQVDVDGYRNPGELPAGPVLVVGSGQSGCQIAEELHEAGREVFVACGRTPWLHRRIGDRDAVWWAFETGYMDRTLAMLPSPAARLAANVALTGQGGGRDLNLRTLQRRGVRLLGHLQGAVGREAWFAPDLVDSVIWGDERQDQFMGLVRKLVAERGLPMPDIVPPAPFVAHSPRRLDLTGFGAVVVAAGYRPDYGSWVHCPGAFDDLGFPIQEDGASTVVPGLHFIGVHFMRTAKSSVLAGVGDDAAVVARRIAATIAPAGI